MPFLATLIPALISGGLSLGTGLAGLSEKQHANIPSLLAPPASTPAATPTASQVTSAANTDYATSGAQGGAAPNFYSTLAGGGSLPPIDVDPLKGYFST